MTNSASASAANAPKLGRRAWLEPLVGLVVFAFVAGVGRVALPETVGNHANTPVGRVVCGLVAAVVAVAAFRIWRIRERRVGRIGYVLIAVVLFALPGWLFMDRLTSYWIYGDDWEYIAMSRTFARAVENLFTPHNVHVVPIWRIVSWGVVASGSSLATLPDRMATAAFSCLAIAMTLAGRFAAKETRSTTIGFATAALVGTTALMESAATWFSAAQALGAAIGTLLMLIYLQRWRRQGGRLAFALALLSVVAAGWSWTVGYAAGPVGAAYLAADGRRRCWIAALVVFLTAGAVGGITLKVAGKAIQEQSTISFHGRKTTDAVTVSSGFYHTIQAVPERLVMGSLGVVGEMNIQQATAFLLAVGAIWFATRRGGGRITPLEAAGLALMTCSYALEWTFRGYLPFTSLRGFVPWYDTIPQIGLALFVAGWWSAARPDSARKVFTWRSAGGVLALQILLLTLALPRNEAIFLKEVRVMEPEEAKVFPIPRLQRLWAVYVAGDRADRQRRMLARIDRVEAGARRRGFTRESLREPLGRHVWPEPPVIDDVDLLDLPAKGPSPAGISPAAARATYAPAFVMETEARPTWVSPATPWNPKDVQ